MPPVQDRHIGFAFFAREHREILMVGREQDPAERTPSAISLLALAIGAVFSA
jgi:hypothetical protein